MILKLMLGGVAVLGMAWTATAVTKTNGCGSGGSCCVLESPCCKMPEAKPDCCYPGSPCCYPGSPCCEDSCCPNGACCPDGACCAPK